MPESCQYVLILDRDVEALLITPCESRCISFEGTDNIV